MATLKQQRLREFLRSNGICPSPVPTISPSVQGVGTENLLHSVFSPNYQRPPPPPRTPLQPKTISVGTPVAPNSALSSIGNGSPFSKWTSNSVGSKSYKGLPSIDMISLDYIQKSQSVDDLRQIITVLQADHKCKALLRAAVRRRDQLNGKVPKGTTPLLVNEHQAQNRFADHSLNMSLSSDEEDENLPLAHSLPSNSTALRDYQLQQEIKNLSQTLKSEDEKHRRAEQAYLERIKDLERTQQHSAFQLDTLEKVVSTSKVTTSELTQQLELLREENKAVRGRLDAEREAHVDASKQIQELERMLSQKIDELSKCQACLEDRDGKYRLLLEQARSTLQEVQRERDEMVEKIMQSSSAAMLKVKDSATGPEIVDYLVQTLETTQESNKALKEKASKVDLNRRRDARDKTRTDSRVRATVEENATLKTKNCELMARIQRLTKELEASRLAVKRAVDSAALDASLEWTEKERSYEAAIKALKQKVKEEGTTVPASLYKTELERSRRLTEDVKKLQESLNSQSEKLSIMTPSPKQRSKNFPSTPKTESPPKSAKAFPFATNKSQALSRKLRSKSPKAPRRGPVTPSPVVQDSYFNFSPVPSDSGESAKVRMTRVRAPVTPLARQQDSAGKRVRIVVPENDENSRPNESETLLKQVTFSPVQKSKGRTQVRMNLIRKGGKRLGLQDRFKQARSPLKGATTPSLSQNNTGDNLLHELH